MDDPDERIKKLEEEMASPYFWDDKARAQEKMKELATLKAGLKKGAGYDGGNAIVTIFSGAGGLDAEDWTRMLYEMYVRFIARRKWTVHTIHSHPNDHNGYRNITFEVVGKGAYGDLKHESGVHRLVRVSPFSAKKLRHTSFSLVEVVPKFKKGEGTIPDGEVKIEFSKSSGPGGQNVNKRETAVRVMHIPTGITAHCDRERSQVANREKALEVLAGKVFKFREAVQGEEKEKYYISKTTEAEWGSQIRSYVLHPYKLVKDHRTNTEHKNPTQVLEEGDLDMFIERMKEKK